MIDNEKTGPVSWEDAEPVLFVFATLLKNRFAISDIQKIELY